MCHRRGAHVACTRTAASVQERKYGHVCTYRQGLERLLAHTYMAGSERRNSVVVVFMGRQRNASCSSGGNGTCGSQPAGSERNAGSCSSGGLGRKRRWKRGLAYRTTEETDLLHSEMGPVDREGSGIPQNGGNGPPTVETGVLLIGRGVAYHKTDETDLLRSKRGSCRSGGV